MDRHDPTDPLVSARMLGPKIASAADEIERTRRIPPSLMAQIHDARLARLLLPRAFGGDQIHPLTYLLTLQEVARHDGSVAWNLFVANSSCLITPSLEPDTARTIYSEPQAWVAWGPPDAQRARAVEGGFIVDGTWGFASGCRQATWLGAHCMVEETDGSLRLNGRGHPSITTLLFPVKQATLLDTWDTLGLRGTASDSYRVAEVFVPATFTGTREEPEERRIPGQLYWFTQQGLYAVGVAGVGLGIAQAMLDAFRELAVDKTPRGLARLAEQPAVRGLVARAEASLGSARTYLIDVLGEQFASAREWGAMPVPERAKLRLATTHAIISAIDVADRIHKAAGVSAIVRSCGPFERRFRDIHTLSQQIQSRDSHFEAVGGILLGEQPAAFY